MRHTIEKYCKGIFRSYKTFHKLGGVLQHSVDSYHEWNFMEGGVLKIIKHQNNGSAILCNTAQWKIEVFKGYIHLFIEPRALQYEIITLSDSDLVALDCERNEKLFFVRLPAWERLIKQGEDVVINDYEKKA